MTWPIRRTDIEDAYVKGFITFSDDLEKELEVLQKKQNNADFQPS